MNYHRLLKSDIANGKGFRLTLFVSGCTHACPNCQNPQTWDPNSGKPFTEETMTKLLTELKKWKCDGLSLSGGDPLYPRKSRDNQRDLQKGEARMSTEGHLGLDWIYNQRTE